MLRGPDDKVARIGHRLSAYDSLHVGVYVARPIIFEELGNLLASRQFCTVADSMQALAEVGRLRYLEVGELTCNSSWFGHETMQVCPLSLSLTLTPTLALTLTLAHTPCRRC